jgi:RNA polymerase sigma-70 factor (sigma-E family)
MQRVWVRRDDEVAALFDRSYVPMCRLAYVILGDRHAAEEVVMDALLKTFSGWARVRRPDKADVYLRRAVINGCRSRIRRGAVEARVNALAQGRAERAAPALSPEASAVGRSVWEAVKLLPGRQRACVVLRYLEDLPEAEIAAVLDCSIGTVKSQLSKARAKLELLLADEWGGAR